MGQGQGAHGPPVEGVLERQDPGAAATAVPAGDLEGGLVGLGPGVGQEDLGLVRWQARKGQGDECLGEADLGGGGEEVRDVAEGAELVAHGLNDRGVGVAQAVDGDAREEIGVLLAVGVPDVGALATDQDPAGGAEGIHDGAGVTLQPAGITGTAGVVGPPSGGLRVGVRQH